MFNQGALTEFYRRSKELKDIQQNGKIVKMVNSVKEFMETSREVEPEYRERAIVACVAEFVRQYKIGRQRINRW